MMNYFGLTPEELAKRGAHWTAQEIAQQPVIWQRVERLIAQDAGLDAFLAPLLQRRDLRIVLTGAGTSAFIGECLAPALLRQGRRAAVAISTTDLVSGPANYLVSDAPTLLVSFARSGNSPESVAAVELVEQCVTERYHLVVTCNSAGELCKRAAQLANARALVLPDETNDRGFAMTSSFTSMVLAAALLFKVPLVGPASRASQDLLASWSPRIQSIVAERFERIIYLGAGELKGLAREAALKMLELTDGRVVSVADTPLGFRHGPKTIVNGKALAVVLLSNDAYTRKYDLDLLAELRGDRIAGRVIALMARHEGSSGHPDDILIPGLADASDLGLCLPYALFAQSFALQQSLSLGIRSDTPNAAGTVSRVVKGVSIHPLERRV